MVLRNSCSSLSHFRCRAEPAEHDFLKIQLCVRSVPPKEAKEAMHAILVHRLFLGSWGCCTAALYTSSLLIERASSISERDRKGMPAGWGAKNAFDMIYIGLRYFDISKRYTSKWYI